MKTPKGKVVFVFDNEGKTFDRFTIVTKEDGMLFGASEHPFNPLGFGQYCGDIPIKHENSLVKKYMGYVNEFVDNARVDKSWLGKEITKFTNLPEDVQKYVEQISE